LVLKIYKSPVSLFSFDKRRGKQVELGIRLEHDVHCITTVCFYLFTNVSFVISSPGRWPSGFLV